MNAQLPNSYFTSDGTLPAYCGVRKVAGAAGTDFSDNDVNVVAMLADSAPPEECLKGGVFNINNVSDSTILWLITELYNVNSSYQYEQQISQQAAIGEPGVIDVPNPTDLALAGKDLLMAFAPEKNRQFIKQFLTNGNYYVKEVKGKWMLIFKGNPQIREWVKGTKYGLNNPSVKIFKTYANMSKGNLEGYADIAKDVSKFDAPLNLIVIAAVDTLEYFVSGKQQGETLKDLLEQIGIDEGNTELAFAISLGIMAGLLALPFELAAGTIIVVGLAVNFLVGIAVEEIEDNWPSISNVFDEMDQKAKNFFDGIGDKVTQIF